MGQEFPTESHYRSIGKGTSNPKSQSVHNVCEIIRRCISRQPTTRNASLDGAPNFLHIKLVNRHICYLVFPTVPRMRPLQKESLICFLRHDRSGRTDALIWASVIGARQAISRRGNP